nr:MAG TPA: hypothetical protein [Caudoviricetes sp.]
MRKGGPIVIRSVMRGKVKTAYKYLPGSEESLCYVDVPDR